MSMRSKTVLGYRSQLVAAIRADRTGAEVTIDLTTARRLVEICDQLARIERQHEQPEEDTP